MFSFTGKYIYTIVAMVTAMVLMWYFPSEFSPG